MVQNDMIKNGFCHMPYGQYKKIDSKEHFKKTRFSKNNNIIILPSNTIEYCDWSICVGVSAWQRSVLPECACTETRSSVVIPMKRIRKYENIFFEKLYRQKCWSENVYSSFSFLKIFLEKNYFFTNLFFTNLFDKNIFTITFALWHI